MVPYTTKSGLQIGRLYQPPKKVMYRDEEIVQRAMLGIKNKRTFSAGGVAIFSGLCYLLFAIFYQFK
jgi:hypothetical protein